MPILNVDYAKTVVINKRSLNVGYAGIDNELFFYPNALMYFGDSKEAISKKGYVQRELKEAFKVLDEYPKSQIYLIPVRLDDCKPLDEELQNIHWIDMFPDWRNGFVRILKAIESQIR